MIEYARELVAALDECETKIREIGAEAFRNGDDQAVGSASSVVHAIKGVRSKLYGESEPTTPKLSLPSVEPGTETPKTTRGRRLSGKSKKFRYEIRNGSVVRIGWSKKNKESYEHKVSMEAFHQALSAMDGLAKNGSGPFMAERIIDCLNDSSVQIPAYQVYVVIGFLKEQGCLNQCGREGYEIPKDIVDRAKSELQQYEELTK